MEALADAAQAVRVAATLAGAVVVLGGRVRIVLAATGMRETALTVVTVVVEEPPIVGETQALRGRIDRNVVQMRLGTVARALRAAIVATTPRALRTRSVMTVRKSPSTSPVVSWTTT